MPIKPSAIGGFSIMLSSHVVCVTTPPAVKGPPALCATHKVIVLWRRVQTTYPIISLPSSLIVQVIWMRGPPGRLGAAVVTSTVVNVVDADDVEKDVKDEVEVVHVVVAVVVVDVVVVVVVVKITVVTSTLR